MRALHRALGTHGFVREAPDDLNRAEPAGAMKTTPRDVFCYLIHGGKSRAPHGARALIERLD